MHINIIVVIAIGPIKVCISHLSNTFYSIWWPNNSVSVSQFEQSKNRHKKFLIIFIQISLSLSLSLSLSR